MKLMFVVLNQVELLDPLLESFMDKGIRGATILSSRGMARELSQNEDYPVFGTLRFLFDPERQENKTIFMVIDDDQVSTVKESIEEVVGDLDAPDSAVFFTVPVADVGGIIKN